MSIVTSLAAVPGADLKRAAGAIMAGAADITLLVDGAGIVRGVSMSDRLGGVDAAAVQDMPVSALVERRDRPGLDSLLAAAAGGKGGAAELRHLPPAPTAAPVRYTALCRDDGAILLVGRVITGARPPAGALRALVGDRDAGRRHAVEARYKALFETAAEAVLIVSLDAGLVEEANPRALAALGAAPDVSGRPLAALFDLRDTVRLDRHLALARDGGEFPPLSVLCAGSGRTLALQGRVFRAFDRTQLMLRLAEPGAVGTDQRSPAIALVARLMRDSSNALALTDRSGRVIWTNAAFDALGSGLGRGMHGRTLAELTEFSAPALDAILQGARDRGRISLADARLRLGASRSAPDSADAPAIRPAAALAEGRLTVIALPDDCAAGFGLVFRPFGQPAAEAVATVPDLQAGADADPGADATGGAGLKELLRDTTDTIERSCIEAALRLTGGNRAAAAKVLGLSRQSLYVKMRRFQLS